MTASTAQPKVVLPDTALAILLFLDGVAIGLLSVFFLPLWIGGTPLPVMVLVAAVANIALVISAAQLTDRVGIVAAPLIGWAIIYIATAIGGPGGDAILPPDWRALLLLFVGGVPAAMWLGNRALARSFARGSEARPIR